MFHALALLVNIALEECNEADDFTVSKRLLDMSAHVVHASHAPLPDDSLTEPVGENWSDHAQRAPALSSVGAEGMVEPSARQLLRWTVKRHKMWSNVGFWEFSFAAEVQDGVSTLMRDDAGMTAMDSFCFELASRFIFNMLSLGVGVLLTREFVLNTCHKYSLSTDQTSTLYKLVKNIHLADGMEVE